MSVNRLILKQKFRSQQVTYIGGDVGQLVGLSVFKISGNIAKRAFVIIIGAATYFYFSRPFLLDINSYVS